MKPSSRNLHETRVSRLIASARVKHAFRPACLRRVYIIEGEPEIQAGVGLAILHVEGTMRRLTLAVLLASSAFGRCPFCRSPPLSAVQTCSPELALYSLTERANSPFHAEPAQNALRRMFQTCTTSCGRAVVSPTPPYFGEVSTTDARSGDRLFGTRVLEGATDTWATLPFDTTVWRGSTKELNTRPHRNRS
jgi:hypothetical protein